MRSRGKIMRSPVRPILAAMAQLMDGEASSMIGVIADDLTGAAELAAVGFRHGLKSEILIDGKPSGAPNLCCLDTDSRSCPLAEAAQRAADAARTLTNAGAKWIYKKTDSVLRGNVTP